MVLELNYTRDQFLKLKYYTAYDIALLLHGTQNSSSTQNTLFGKFLDNKCENNYIHLYSAPSRLSTLALFELK